MSLKIKMLLLSIIPLILVTVVITMISLNQARQLSEQEIKTFEENLLRSKRRELQHYVDLAMTSIAHILAKARPGDRAVEEEVKRRLHSMTYGDDGYFFVYDQYGVNLVHPVQPELVGVDLFDLQDRNGKYVIHDLLQLAGEGGGFYRYIWKKPSKGGLEDKLSYVVQIPTLDWMMGTGLYIDDIAEEVAAIRQKVTDNIHKTFYIVVAILTGTILVIALIGLAINVHASRLADNRLRKIIHRYVQFQVNQRRHFARELHDGINQLMVSVKFRIELAKDKLRGQNGNIVGELDKGGAALNQAISEVRRISHDLRPIQLDDLGLESALHSMSDEFYERTGIQVIVHLEMPYQRLPDDIEITLYRIAQEALTNVERHANAVNVELSIWLNDGLICIEIEDDGCGFVSEDNECDGIGLLNMRERTELLGGHFSIQSRPDKGTVVTAEFALVD